MEKKKKEKKAVPFFARLLESQSFPEVKTGIKAGPRKPPVHTLKYPSDDDPGLP